MTAPGTSFVRGLPGVMSFVMHGRAHPPGLWAHVVDGVLRVVSARYQGGRLWTRDPEGGPWESVERTALAFIRECWKPLASDGTDAVWPVPRAVGLEDVALRCPPDAENCLGCLAYVPYEGGE